MWCKVAEYTVAGTEWRCVPVPPVQAPLPPTLPVQEYEYIWFWKIIRTQLVSAEYEYHDSVSSIWILCISILSTTPTTSVKHCYHTSSYHQHQQRLTTVKQVIEGDVLLLSLKKWTGMSSEGECTELNRSDVQHTNWLSGRGSMVENCVQCTLCTV